MQLQPFCTKLHYNLLDKPEIQPLVISFPMYNIITKQQPLQYYIYFLCLDTYLSKCLYLCFSWTFFLSLKNIHSHNQLNNEVSVQTLSDNSTSVQFYVYKCCTSFLMYRTNTLLNVIFTGLITSVIVS